MELRLEIGYNELLELIRQLPVNQLEKLKSELSEKIIDEKSKKKHLEFQVFLLNGPIMADDQ